MISSAQNFEDVLLERLFHSKKRGFYVDVGAWDPNRYSVTRHFYDRGWRGINVEPIARRHELFVNQRPRDINLHRLIGANPSTRRFFECLDADYLSTMVAEIADDLRKAGHEVDEYEVEVDTLDAIFERHCPKVVDFLKVDTEGSEAEVLRTLDLTKHRPRALIVESTVPGSGLKSWDEPNAFGTWDEWEQGVLDAGYHFAHFDGLNRFYVRREDRKLAARFAIPPGIFDGIDCSDNWQTRAVERLDVIDQQQAELKCVRETAEATIAELRRNIDVSEAGRGARDEVVAKLEEQLAAGERDHASQSARVDLLTAEVEKWRQALADAERAASSRIDAIEGEHAAHEAMVAQLRQQLEATEHDRAARLAIIEQLNSKLDEGRQALLATERASAVRVDAVEADRVARGELIDSLVAQLGAVERDRAARLSLIERLTTDLGQSRQALDEGERAATIRIEAVEADRVARGEVIDGLVEHLTAIERDRAARLGLIERLTADLDESRRALDDADRAATMRIEAVEADRVARGEVIDELVEHLTAIERDRAARLGLIERLTADLGESRRALEESDRAAAARIEAVEADRIARGEVIGGLVEQLAAVERDRAARLGLIERLTAYVDEGRRALDDANHEAAARIETVEADRLARGEVIGGLVEQLAAVERDRAARLGLIERLTVHLDESRRALDDAEGAAAARIEAVEADRIARGEVIAGLVGQLTAVERDRAARLTLIERLTADLVEGRRALEDAERAAATRIEAVEADRVARGEVIAGLIERLKAADASAGEQKSLIDRLDEAVRDGGRRISACERAISERDGELAAKQQAIDDARGQLLEAERLMLERGYLIDRKTNELGQLAERLAVVSAEAAALRQRWSHRIYSYFTRRA